MKLGATIITGGDGRRTTGKILPTGDFRLFSVSWPGGESRGNVLPGDMPRILAAQELETLGLLGHKAALNYEICRLIGQLPNLTSLSLQGTNVKDEWLKPIGKRSSLSSFNFGSTAITDAGVAMLTGLDNLERLDANNTTISLGALSKLPWIGHLKKLSFGKTDAVLEEEETRMLFESAAALEILWLNAGVKSLAGVQKLRRLQDIQLPPPVTAEHLKNLAAAPSLTSLTLKDCQVADGDWRELPALKQLKSLKLVRTPATAALHRALKDSNPQLKLEVVDEPKDSKAPALAATNPAQNAPAPVVPAPPQPPVEVPAWLSEARKKGGPLRAKGTLGGAPVDLGEVAAFSDFVEIHGGSVARRANGELCIVSGTGGKLKIQREPSVSAVSRGGTTVTFIRPNGQMASVTMTNGIDLPVAVGKLPDFTTLLTTGSSCKVAIDQSGRVVDWLTSPVGMRPPEDFFLGSTATASRRNGLLVAAPGGAVRWWFEKEGVVKVPDSKDMATIVEADTGYTIAVARTASGSVRILGNTEKGWQWSYPPTRPAVKVRAITDGYIVQTVDGTWQGGGATETFVRETGASLGTALDVSGYSNRGTGVHFIMWIEGPKAPKQDAATERWESAREDSLGRLTRVAEGWRLEGSHTFTTGPARDGAVRVRAAFSSELPQLRLVGRKSAIGDNLYQVFIKSDGSGAGIQRRKDGQYPGIGDITATPLATPLRPGDLCEMEARFVGRKLTVKINGQIVIQGERLGLPEGFLGVYTGAGVPVTLQSIEFLNLDQPISPAPAPATATKDAPFINSLGMKFVAVPITGGPTHGQRVLFSVWETRVKDYWTFATDANRTTWPNPGFEQTPNHPAVNVNWDDAVAFCAWLTERERKAGKIDGSMAYRLPLDHEWSCAIGIGAREDASKLPSEKSVDAKVSGYPWGTTWPPPEKSGNYWSEELRPLLGSPPYHTIKGELPGYRDGFAASAPVGSYAANELGIFDLGGNAWEWCADWYGRDQTSRVRRGGSWDNSQPNELAAGTRAYNEPSRKGNSRGFRAVLAPSGAVGAP